jgi:hypothetical protein
LYLSNFGNAKLRQLKPTLHNSKSICQNSKVTHASSLQSKLFHFFFSSKYKLCHLCFESHSDRTLGTEKEEMALKLRLSSGDISGFKFLFSLALMYGLMAMLVYSIIHMKFVKPLGIDAPLNRFSEDRAVKHVRVLSEEIDGRQVSLNISIPNFFFQFLVFIIIFYLISQSSYCLSMLYLIVGIGLRTK